MEAKRYHLSAGTVLDGRYTIGGVLGEGGFGITYAGTNERIGLKVAIKEFFCRDYMDRADDGSDHIVLTEKDVEERFLKEKERFLKEARTLSDFAGESGIVQVNDYFESNGTAYIVMGFIPGVTLKDYVREHGRMNPEDLFRKIKPLLATLGKLHSAGLVHRDISPDNIMLTEDGSLCLIDFGAAAHYNNEEKTFSIISKTGYAAPEQYRQSAAYTPASDIYSLCASIYYTLTGIVPEDSLQRILVDELIPVSETGANVPEKAESVIKKGMALKASERWQSTADMLSAIEEVYPEAQQMTATPHKKKAVIISICTALLILIIAGLLVYFIPRRVELKLRGMDTEVIWLNADESMSVSEYRHSGDIVKSRLEVLAGRDNYLWREETSGYRMEMPKDVLCGLDPYYVCKAYLTRPLNIYIIDTDMAEAQSIDAYAEAAVPISRDAIAAAAIEEGEIPWADRAAASLPESGDYRYFSIELTKDIADAVNAAFKGLLLEEGRGFCLYYDLLEEFSSGYYYQNCYSTGDGKTFVFTDHDQDGHFLDSLLYTLTHEPSDQAFTIVAEDIVNWEDPTTSMVAGEYQVKSDDIASDYITLAYTFSSSTSEKKAAWYHRMIAFKQRLDTLGYPYAFGLLEYDESTYIIRMKNAGITAEEIDILGKATCDMYIGTKWNSYDIRISLPVDTMTIDRTRNGLCLSFTPNGYTLDSIKENIAKVRSQGIGEAFLFCASGDYPIARVDMDELENAVASGTVIFTDLLFEDDGKFAEFLKTCYTEDLGDYSSGRLSQIRYISGLDEQPKGLSTDDFPTKLVSIYPDESLFAALEASVLSEGGRFSKSVSPENGYSLDIVLYNRESESLTRDMLSYIEDLYTTYKDAFDSGDIHTADIYFSPDSPEDQEPEYLYINLGKSYDYYRPVLNEHIYAHIADNSSILKEANAFLEGSSVLKELLKDDVSEFTVN